MVGHYSVNFEERFDKEVLLYSASRHEVVFFYFKLNLKNSNVSVESHCPLKRRMLPAKQAATSGEFNFLQLSPLKKLRTPSVSVAGQRNERATDVSRGIPRKTETEHER